MIHTRSSLEQYCLKGVLIRTILSQRTRDENTDQAANALFDVYPDIYAVADAPVEEVR